MMRLKASSSLGLVEGQAAVDAIGYVALAHGLLEDAALGIGAVEHGKIGISIARLAAQSGYLVHHHLALLHVAVGLEDADGLAKVFLGKHVLVYLPLVLAYQTVGGGHDGLRGAVVLLQLENACAGIGLGEVEDIVDVGPAEGVDALRIVAHHADVLVVLGQLEHDAVLGHIRVLILVHEDVAELLLVAGQHVGMVAEEQEGIEQQVVEVHRVGLAATLPVAAIDVAQSRYLGRAVVLIRFLVAGIVGRRHEVVLRVGDARLDQPRLINLLVELHLLDNGAYQALAVGRVIDGELMREAQHIGFGMQDAQEEAVERSHPHPACPFGTHLPSDARLHLARRLVRKGQGQDVPRLVTVLQQPGYLIGQHAGLPRARPRYHQRGAVVVEHSGPLALVQFVDIVGHHQSVFSLLYNAMQR